MWKNFYLICGGLAAKGWGPSTNHLKGIVGIAIMGCIVNGPGEMADADFGYVWGADREK